MIGIYGIIEKESTANSSLSKTAFQRMSSDVDGNIFSNQSIHGTHYSVGLTCRMTDANKDLSLKEIRKDFIIAFSGYGKFRGENKLYWAEDMIDRIATRFVNEGKNTIKHIEGSFLLFIILGKSILIANDRFASKNFFYYDSDRFFIFAPDVGRILATDIAKKEKNIEAAIQLLSAGFFLDDNTLVKNIFRMPHASIIETSTHDSSPSTLTKYWQFPCTEGKNDELTPQLTDEFSSLMEQSIFEMADLEERFTIPLSGGLDSRTIACFLSKRYPLTTLTYDTKEEAVIAKQVCRVLNADFYYFSNRQLKENDFRDCLYRSVSDQKSHAIINQYFYHALFKKYFFENKDKIAIFDGVYLDVLFSGPYVFQKFEFEDFLRAYGGGSAPIIARYSNLSREHILETMHDVYSNLLEEFGRGDGVGKSQFYYSVGRLRRYVLESGNSRLNYCYVFNPGFNYDLADFGYGLTLRLRKGLLYKHMMFKNFPDVMKIRFKDSYGIRRATLGEKLRKKYIDSRLKISYASNGLIKYYPYQFEYYFLKENRLDDYRDIFMKESCIKEIFNNDQLKEVFRAVKKKQWMINLFQRVLFIQQFYARNVFS